MKLKEVNTWQYYFQKFDWTKCSAVAILAKVNGKSVVAIVKTRSAGVAISESCFKRLGLVGMIRWSVPSPLPLIPTRNLGKFFMGSKLQFEKVRIVSQHWCWKDCI